MCESLKETDETQVAMSPLLTALFDISFDEDCEDGPIPATLKQLVKRRNLERPEWRVADGVTWPANNVKRTSDL